MRSLYGMAADRGVSTMIVKMMRPQVGARKICEKLGFRREVLLADYVTDLAGESQDMIIMTCDLDALWDEIEPGHFAKCHFARDLTLVGAVTAG